MRRVDLVQGTAEWLAWRRGGLGGSDIAAIMGLSPFEDATREQIKKEKLFGSKRETNFAMRRGTALEPVARRLFAQRYGGGQWLPMCGEDEYAPWCKVSLDGINEDWTEILEIKCTNWKTHDAWLAGIVPDYYAVQMQWQMLLVGPQCRVCHATSFNNGQRFGGPDDTRNHLAHVVVEADPERQAEILTAAEDFWKEIEAERIGLSLAKGNN